MKKNNTSWQKSSKWYSKIVSDKGHYYHQKIVIPSTLRLLDLKPGDSLLDLACGQGILARNITQDVEYYGIDSAPSLIDEAKKFEKNNNHKYYVSDVTKSIPIHKADFDAVAIILALQNIRHPHLALLQASQHIKLSGKLVIVLNHPCFRIPRQSSWGIDSSRKIEYRRIDKYMSEMEIPITTHPGKEKSPITWTFHHPLSNYFSWLKDAGFVVESMEEWISDKESVGKAAKMENRSRNEFPLFLAIVAKK